MTITKLSNRIKKELDVLLNNIIFDCKIKYAMAISIKKLKTKPISKVTFTYTNLEVNELMLVGDFNEWEPTATPFKKIKKGFFKIVLNLDSNKTYQYRFLADGKYINDDDPQALIFNKYANTENCLLQL